MFLIVSRGKLLRVRGFFFALRAIVFSVSLRHSAILRAAQLLQRILCVPDPELVTFELEDRHWTAIHCQYNSQPITLLRVKRRARFAAMYHQAPTANKSSAFWTVSAQPSFLSKIISGGMCRPRGLSIWHLSQPRLRNKKRESTRLEKQKAPVNSREQSNDETSSFSCTETFAYI